MPLGKLGERVPEGKGKGSTELSGLRRARKGARRTPYPKMAKKATSGQRKGLCSKTGCTTGTGVLLIEVWNEVQGGILLPRFFASVTHSM